MHFKCLGASHKLNQTVNILRDIQTVLPGIGLCIIKIDLIWVKRSKPLVSKATLHKPAVWVINVLVILSSADVILVIFLLAHGLSHLGNGPVVIGVFQCLGNRLAFQFHRYKTKFFIAF